MIAETAIRTCISAIATADLNGRLTYVNPTFLKIWGYNNPEEVLGRSIASLCKEEMQIQGVVQTLRVEGALKQWSWLGTRRTGQSSW